MSSETTPLVVGSNSSSDATVAATSSLRRARRLLYVSHFSSQFSQQSWEFGLTLFLAAFTNYQSLLLVSTYGIVSGLVICLGGPSAGRWFVDDLHWNRRAAARFLIGTQNGSVVITSVLCYMLLLSTNKQQLYNESSKGELNWFQSKFLFIPLDVYSVLMIVGIHIFGSLSQILDKAFLVSIERDWVVVMGEEARSAETTSPSNTWLSETNVAMKQIDLSCRVAAPSFAGFIIGASVSAASGHSDHSKLAFAAFLIGLLNVVSLAVEYICTARIYQLVPALAIKHSVVSAKTEVPNGTNNSNGTIAKPIENGGGSLWCNWFNIPPGLRIYLAQPISGAGVSLALLYFNVLTFGSLMTAYLVSRGMGLETVALWRGVSSTLGLTGTFAFRFMSTRFSLVTTGMWSILYQLFFISISMLSFVMMQHNGASLSVFVIGVCASRIGLWVFDIAVTQLMQEFIPEGIRGAIGGTQQALNAFFQLSSFCFGFAFPSVQDFPIYAFLGYITVVVSALIYLKYVYMRKDSFLTRSDRMRLEL